MATEDALGLVARVNQELDKATAKVDKLIAALKSSNTSTGGVGGGVMPNSLANISTLAHSANRMETMAGVMGGVGQMASGVFSMLPDTGAVVQRAGSYYGATLRIGSGMSRKQLQNVTFNGLQGGITSAGSDQQVAGYLGAAGMQASGLAGSTYQQTLRSVGNAAKYLNMDNLSAARAIEGLTSGQGSGNMMNMYGIFTADPRTGKEYTQGQIFEQMAQRFTAGQGKATVAETLASLRRGALGSNIRNSGMTADQQAMFSQFMIERAKGNYMDLSDTKAMEKLLGDPNNENPFAAGYRLNTAATGAMQSAEGTYLKAIEDVTPALENLHKAAGTLADGFLGYAKAMSDTFMGSSVGGGAMSAVSGLGGAASSLMTGYFASKSITGFTGKGGPSKGSTKAPTAAAKGGTVMKGTGAGVAATLAGEGIKALTGNEQGSAGNKFGNALSTAGQWASMAALTAFIPGVNAFTPAIMGAAALAGGVVGAVTGGTSSSVGLGPASGNTDDGMGFARPVASGEVSAAFGQKGSIWNAGYHKGTDYAVPLGTSVYAAAAGKVINAKNSPGNDGQYTDFGKYVKIDHGNGYVTIYAHLSEVSVHVGDEVQKGQLIGKSGATGKVTGPHLHFEVQKNGQPVSPGSLASGTVGAEGTATTSGDTKQTGSLDSSVLGVVMGKGSGIAPLLSFGTSGVKGNFQTTAQVVASGMTAGITGVSSPMVAATGGGLSSPSASGGTPSSIGLGVNSAVTQEYGASSPVKSVTNATGYAISPTVNITVNVARASEAEAMRMVDLVKQHLEDKELINMMGRR